jgi:hypothetical protein
VIQPVYGPGQDASARISEKGFLSDFQVKARIFAKYNFLVLQELRKNITGTEVFTTKY